MKTVFAFLILISASQVSAQPQDKTRDHLRQKLTCVEGQLRLPLWKTNEQEKSAYCYNNKRDVLYSKNCQDKSCLKDLDFASVSEDLLFGEYGTPMARLCMQLQGRAEFVEFEANKKWHKVSRCLFKNGEFIDVDSLFYFYKSQRQ